MPSKHRQIIFRVPPEKEGLIEALDRLGEQTGRDRNGEIIHAIERHLAQPPVVRIETPPLVPVAATPSEKPKRGRPRKRD
jgi:hypothetical protein